MSNENGGEEKKGLLRRMADFRKPKGTDTLKDSVIAYDKTDTLDKRLKDYRELGAEYEKLIMSYVDLDPTAANYESKLTDYIKWERRFIRQVNFMLLPTSDPWFSIMDSEHDDNFEVRKSWTGLYSNYLTLDEPSFTVAEELKNDKLMRRRHWLIEVAFFVMARGFSKDDVLPKQVWVTPRGGGQDNRWKGYPDQGP